MSIAATDASWPERRFSQAIAEGDGISLIPAVSGDVGALARAAEEAGAEAILVDSTRDVGAARTATGLPVVARLHMAHSVELDAAREDGADAVAIPAAALADENAGGYGYAVALGLDCAIGVADEDELQATLQALDPEILMAALDRLPQDGESGGFGLLTDVPAGKLVVVQGEPQSRDAAVALERAGVDALVFPAPSGTAELAALLCELGGAEHPLD